MSKEMMNMVSILLPNLNNREYLEERMKSIWEQTFTNWELIVLDGYSNDGSWEYFQSCAKRDKRIRIFQSDEKGIYNNFNKCIELARGKYIYIATSDDTMYPEALEKMVAALEENVSCEIAHCKLKIINEDGIVSKDKIWDNFFIVRYFGDMINKKHIRVAPHDGMLHFSGITVYTSLTQLLIKKQLFNRIGLFRLNFRSLADYEWVMRATLVSNTIHIPEYLATWRVHEKQATSSDKLIESKADGLFIKMANSAVRTAKKVNPAILKGLNIKEWKDILRKEKLFYEIKNATRSGRYMILMKWILIGPLFLAEFIRSEKTKKKFLSQPDTLEYIKKMVEKNSLKFYQIKKNEDHD